MGKTVILFVSWTFSCCGGKQVVEGLTRKGQGGRSCLHSYPQTAINRNVMSSSDVYLYMHASSDKHTCTFVIPRPLPLDLQQLPAHPSEPSDKH